MKWQFESGRPIYLQIVDELTMRIANGTYPPGAKLPSVRDLAIEAGVNPNTMQRAMSEMESRGLVHSERTSGRFVTKEEQVLKELHDGLAAEYIREFVEKLRRIGIKDEDIADAVNRWLKGDK
jgi:GntR family transcriptional regulator